MLHDLACRSHCHSLKGDLTLYASPQLIVDGSVPRLTAKAVVGLTSQPKVDVSISTGRQQYLVGASAQYDSATSSLTTWSLGAGYTAADYQVSNLTL